ncbi:hypothetical protein ACHAXR_007560 [Thalassiosira sp. AJA248-18]
MQSKSKEGVCSIAPDEGGSLLNENLPPALPPFDVDALHRPTKKPKAKESIVDHTYRDYSTIEVPRDEKERAEGKRANKKAIPCFPEKLHVILSNSQYSHIIRWQPHGRSWKVVDKHLLTTIILPDHFSHGNFASFNRSVNGWGFKPSNSLFQDKNTYYHECFLRGRPELTSLLQRLMNPGKRLPNKSGEPDFYEISRKYPLPPTLPLAPSCGMSLDQNPALPSSPKNAHPPGHQPVMFSSPFHQPNSPHVQMLGAIPPQQPQQMYWSNPLASPYHPYPPMMMAPPAGMQQPGMMQTATQGMMMVPQPGMQQLGMMQAGPQGTTMAPQPGMQQPGMMQTWPQGYYWVPLYHPSAAHYFLNKCTMAAAATPTTTLAGTATPATMPGQTVAATVSNRGGADEVTPTAPSTAEAVATVREKSHTGKSQDMKPGGGDEVAPTAPSATEATATVREESPTGESQDMKPAAQKESDEENGEEEKIAEV